MLKQQMECNKELADQIRVLTDRLVLITDSRTYYATTGAQSEIDDDPALYYGAGQDLYEERDAFGQKIITDRLIINRPESSTPQNSHI